MKKIFVAIFMLASAMSFAESKLYMECNGINQYDQNLSVDVYTEESNALSVSVAAELKVLVENDSEFTVIPGSILNKHDMLGDYQFISNDGLARFITSGSLYSIDNYYIRSLHLYCKVINPIFTSRGNAR